MLSILLLGHWLAPLPYTLVPLPVTFPPELPGADKHFTGAAVTEAHQEQGWFGCPLLQTLTAWL